MIERRWAEVSGLLLGALLVFAVRRVWLYRPAGADNLPGWILALAQPGRSVGSFVPTPCIGSILLVSLGSVLLCGIWQIASGASSYAFQTLERHSQLGDLRRSVCPEFERILGRSVRSRFLRYMPYAGSCLGAGPAPAFCHSGK